MAYVREEIGSWNLLWGLLWGPLMGPKETYHYPVVRVDSV